MKYAILLAFAAFAFLAQADANPMFGFDLDRGALAEALKQKLTAAKEKLDEMINKAQDTIKEKLTEAKKSAEHLIEQLKNKAHEISDNVFVAAQNILDKTEASLNASLAEDLDRAHNVEGISECMLMKDTIRLATMALIANTTGCINYKIEQAESYLIDVYVTPIEALNKIMGLKNKSEDCMNVKRMIQIPQGITCLAQASIQGSVVIANAISAVTIDIAKLATEISTLQTSLPTCMSTNALWTIAEQAQGVLVSIKDCIQEKLEQSNAPAKENLPMQMLGQENESDIEIVDKLPELEPYYQRNNLVVIQQ